MQKLPESGKVKNIGVSNFAIKNLEKLLNDPSCKTVPAVNQVELHPNVSFAITPSRLHSSKYTDCFAEPIPQARCILQRKRYPLHRLLLPRLHRLSPIQGQDPSTTRREERSERATMPSALGSPERMVGDPEECHQVAHREEL